MPLRRTATVLALTAATTVLGSGTAAAHGSMENPLSRVEGCYLEGPEHPKSAACAAAIRTGGTQAMYDWNGVRIGDAAGRHRELVPDGKLCSAGAPEFAGLDLPRADWNATHLTPGSDVTLRYRATAPHRGTFRLYLTNAGYDPTKPLRWADLETTPFLTVTDPRLTDGSYLLPGRIPTGRTSRQLIYAIWQRSDSPEAFYSCSDVVLDGATTGTGPAPATPTPRPTTPTPTPTASPGTSSPTPAPVPAAAVTTTPPSSPTAPAVPTAPAPHQLAQTGSSRTSGTLLTLGATLLLVGGTIAVITRGRGAHRRRPH
ncbi:lytic polysaccharide monooxygenase [Kitasatospora sp. NPDC048365]|uniref:lytic polysaccharide monooxygenase auxiliary activity family 9 protein n=1 Tax=Kitasatospora sp. NPDC048365 TaxID=3364050 RepID=UPI00370FBFD3